MRKAPDHRPFSSRGTAIEMLPRRGMAMLCVAAAISAAACSSRTALMPTPTVYTNPEWNPFADVPPALQGDTISVLYVTDRVPTGEQPGHWDYGSERSRSAAFGEAKVRLGDGASWDEVVAASRTSQRRAEVFLSMDSVEQLGRFAPTPPSLVPVDMVKQAADASGASANSGAETPHKFVEELKRRLAMTPRKEVYVFIHGFANSFNDSVFTIAELWHFLGREGVPMAYSWPCGSGGVRDYLYTIFSGQFTNYHLKQTLRLIASVPEVEKIHLIAHSRGTDVCTTAVRELYLETRGTPGETAKLKLGSAVLAAADLDLDVLIEMNVTEGIGRAVDTTATYICHADKALAFSNWLSLGAMRLGDVQSGILTPQELEMLRTSKKVQFVDARVGGLGLLGHSYVHDHPAVSSDMILYLRYGLPPGEEFGRPLGTEEAGFWNVYDDYPGKGWTPPSQGAKSSSSAPPSASAALP